MSSGGWCGGSYITGRRKKAIYRGAPALFFELQSGFICLFQVKKRWVIKAGTCNYRMVKRDKTIFVYNRYLFLVVLQNICLDRVPCEHESV